MKSLFIVFLPLGFLILALQTAQAQHEKYVQAMKSNLEALGKAEGPLDWQNIANKFEQIAKIKTDEWLPNYWAAYATLIVNFQTEAIDKKDLYIDKAEEFLQKAQAMQENNEEIVIMEAYIAMARLAVDGQGRWQTQMPLFNQALNKAEKLSPNNPRINYMRGSNLYHTPEQFGGGKAVACPILQASLAQYASFEPASEIHPNWGKAQLEALMQNCEQ